MTATLPPGSTLEGRWVRLEPIAESDVDALAEVLLDEATYSGGFGSYKRPDGDDAARRLVRDELWSDPGARDGEGRGRLAYTIRLARDSRLGPAGRVVGTSSLAEAHLVNESVHLGWTVIGPAWWGTAVNPESKLLLLGHCFDECGFGRVKIQTDVRNLRSQRAIERMGLVREGVVRRDRPRPDGTWRDTVAYSVLADEWPAVAAGLRRRLEEMAA